MATYPDGIYSPRAKENRSGVVYDATKKTVIFVEDINKSDDEVVAIQNTLGVSGSFNFAKLAGQSGGQTLIGSIDSGGNLTLQSTSHATKGKILFGTSAYDEVNNRLGIGLQTPLYPVHINSVRTDTAIGAVFDGYHYVELDPVDTSSTVIVGERCTVETKSSNAQNFNIILGLAPRVFHRGSGTIADIRGVNLVASNEQGDAGSGIVTYLKGAQFQVIQQGGTSSCGNAIGGYFVISKSGTGGSITNAIGGKFEIQISGTGTITNAYGLFLSPVVQGSTLNYAVYTEGGTVYHATGGATVIGQIIKGAASQSADLLQIQNSAATVLAAFGADGVARIATKTPTSAADTGTTGMIAWDADYIYICTATNTWKRVAIATW